MERHGYDLVAKWLYNNLANQPDSVVDVIDARSARQSQNASKVGPNRFG